MAKLPASINKLFRDMLAVLSTFFSYLFRLINVNVVIVFTITLFVMLSWYRGEITLMKGILLSLFGSLTAISFNKLFLLVGSGRDSLGVQRSSPSIDGSISGWRLTSSLALLLITCVFAVLTILIFFNDIKKSTVVNEMTLSATNTALQGISQEKPEQATTTQTDKK